MLFCFLFFFADHLAGALLDPSSVHAWSQSALADCVAREATLITIWDSTRGPGRSIKSGRRNFSAIGNSFREHSANGLPCSSPLPSACKCTQPRRCLRPPCSPAHTIETRAPARFSMLRPPLRAQSRSIGLVPHNLPLSSARFPFPSVYTGSSSTPDHAERITAAMSVAYVYLFATCACAGKAHWLLLLDLLVDVPHAAVRFRAPPLAAPLPHLTV